MRIGFPVVFSTVVRGRTPKRVHHESLLAPVLGPKSPDHSRGYLPHQYGRPVFCPEACAVLQVRVQGAYDLGQRMETDRHDK